jgi:hypothetical protein
VFAVCLKEGLGSIIDSTSKVYRGKIYDIKESVTQVHSTKAAQILSLFNFSYTPTSNILNREILHTKSHHSTQKYG